MADGERLDRGSSSPANSRRGSRAAPMDAAEEPTGQEPPNNEVCMSFCRHCFCFPCIQEWARRKSVCPRCQRSVNHIFPVRDGRVHGGHEEGRERPARRRSDAGQRRPSGRGNGGSCRRASARGHGRGSAGSRSRRWHRNSRRGSWPGRRSNLRSRRRLWSVASDVGRNAGQGLPRDWAVLGNSRRRSRQQPGMRRRLRRRRGQARGQRRRDWYEQQALRPSLDARFPPRRGEHRQRRGLSRNRGAARRWSRQGQRSHARRRTL